MPDKYYNPTVPAHVPSALVHDHDVYLYDSPDPFTYVVNLFADGAPGIFWTRHNGGHWIILDSDAMIEVARDPARFSSTKFFVPEERNPPPEKAFLPAMVDPPLHTAYRSMIMPMFGPDNISKLEPRIREACRAIIEDILEGGSNCEFMQDFAHIMPVVIFLSLVDFPASDRTMLRNLSARVNDPTGDRVAAMDDLFHYLEPRIDDRLANPGSDVISHIIGQHVEGRALTREEMLNLVITILLGGLDTVASQLGFFAQHLADNPVQRHALCNDPSLIRAAVAELMRRYSIGTFGRVVAQDTELHGVAMKQGDLMAWTTRMSALNPAIHANPMTVDFHRPRSPTRSFGDGIHRCAGAFLATTELRIFLETWLERVPDFSVVPEFKPEWVGSNTISYKQLPLVIGVR